MLVILERKAWQTKQHDCEGIREKSIWHQGSSCKITLYILDNTYRSIFLLVLFLDSLKQWNLLFSLNIKLNWCLDYYILQVLLILCMFVITSSSQHWRTSLERKTRSTSNISLKGRTIISSFLSYNNMNVNSLEKEVFKWLLVYIYLLGYYGYRSCPQEGFMPKTNWRLHWGTRLVFSWFCLV